jgi:hypothetical protein
MIYLPLPEPWTIDSLEQYIDQLVQFVEKYRCIAEYNTHEVYTKGVVGIEWAPDLSIEDWINVTNGRYNEPLPEEFSEFLRLSQTLPLKDEKTYVPTSREVRQGMCRKKAHEIDVMLEFLGQFTRSQGVSATNIVDVGSGVGHLSTQMAKAGYSVIGVEGNQQLSEKLAAQNPIYTAVNRTILAPEDLNVTSDDLISVSLRML